MFMCFAKYIIHIYGCENNVDMSFNVTKKTTMTLYS